MKFDQWLPVPIYETYSIYDNRVVNIEPLGLSVDVTSAPHAALYCSHFDRLWSMALRGDAAMRTVDDGIRRVDGKLRSQES